MSEKAKYALDGLGDDLGQKLSASDIIWTEILKVYSIGKDGRKKDRRTIERKQKTLRWCLGGDKG